MRINLKGIKLNFSLLLLLSIYYHCYNPGPYGYDRHYVPLEDEMPYLNKAITPSYIELVKNYEAYKGRLIAWFGIVKGIKKSTDETTIIYLSHRIHIQRHICEDESRSSCKVTVSSKSYGDFVAYVKLRAQDNIGVNKVQPISLLRIIGEFKGEFDTEGRPIFHHVVYYRHWPKGQYYTSELRKYFRR